VNIKIAGKWMLIPLKIVLIGIDPYPHVHCKFMLKPYSGYPMSFNKHWGQVSSKQGRKIKVSYDITPPCEGAGDPTCNGKFNTKILKKKIDLF